LGTGPGGPFFFFAPPGRKAARKCTKAKAQLFHFRAATKNIESHKIGEAKVWAWSSAVGAR
jgi:hypothetical protein